MRLNTNTKLQAGEDNTCKCMKLLIKTQDVKNFVFHVNQHCMLVELVNLELLCVRVFYLCNK